ncbi:PAS fold-containing protein [Microbacterium sp. ru370.1]|uniref:sensor histidine kinase n=1 Tax=unclassified Microbacterium TaxID=2609290 RepID=UPI00088CFB12|nr:MULTISPECIES: PAS domain-containing sensor histidine kinase [unclassified Microbacterium]SDO28006.1 PAS fold-containing protein [Microbacterium sp. ru370.1]SIT75012.1 PAS fold-containing protein [Microbacterium sp. RU1D]
MPLFEMESTSRGRLRVFLRAQLPFVLGVVFLAGVAGIALPSSLGTPVVMMGAGVSGAATLAALFVPWEKFAPSWMMIVAVMDITAVAFLRAELLPFVPAVSILAIFPVLWLAYGFRWYGIVVAVVGAGFVTSFRFAYVGAWPGAALEWANVITLPTFIVGVAVIVFVAARHLRRKSERLAQAYRDQAAALIEAQDAETVALGILSTVNAGVAFYDADGRLDVANALAHGYAERAGFSLHDRPHVGNDVLAADRSTAVPYSAQLIPRALAGETITDHLEWWGPIDTQAALLASSSQVRRPDGHVLGTVIVIYDITELAEAIEVREHFLRTVSHELRTPMTSITGFLDLLEDAVPEDNATVRRYIEVITRRTNDLFDRVGNLLAASDTQKNLHIVDVDLGEVADEAVRQVAPGAGPRQIQIKTERLGASLLHADPEQLTIATAELLTNAVKFGDARSRVSLQYGVTGAGAIISVRNDGPGITSAEQRRIFDRFYRTPYARAREIQGFGLGLTNVRAIAIAHGGSVRIHSTPGASTTVTLKLPARATGASPSPAHASLPAAPSAMSLPD